MKVLYIATECKPYSKVGGVGDVAAELPVALKEQGVDIEIVTPLYGSTSPDLYDNSPYGEYKLSYQGKDEIVQIHHGQIKGVPVNLLRNPTYFEGKYGTPYIFSPTIPFYDDLLRFSFFSEACLWLINEKKPDIVHINDWALGYLFGRMFGEKMPQKRVLTVHNIGYQGNVGKDTIRGWDIERLLNNDATSQMFTDPRVEWNSINPLRLALELSDMVNTVSPGYCMEITQPEDQSRYFEGGKGLHEIAKRLCEQGKLIGILNGFVYNAKPTDKRFLRTLEEKAEMKQIISQTFQTPEAFLLGFVGRLAEQKFKLLAEMVDGKTVIEHLLDIPGVNIAFLGTGAPEYENLLRRLSGRRNCAVSICFDAARAKQISLGSDVFLMPSLYEPCGITQMESLSNATPPLVRWTGGLLDTVKPYTDSDGTGFGFDGSRRDEVLTNLIKAVIDARDYYQQDKPGFEQLLRRGFRTRFSWAQSAREYIQKLYEPVMG
ncbi:MAG: glycogen/starch synthase [Anaerolineales bacterium]